MKRYTDLLKTQFVIELLRTYLAVKADKDPVFLEANGSQIFFRVLQGGVEFTARATYFESEDGEKKGFTIEYKRKGQDVYQGVETFLVD